MSRDALVIGINTYDRLKLLKSPSADAEAIAQLLERHGGFEVKRLPEIKDKETGQPKVGQTTSVTLTKLEDALIERFNPKGESISETVLLFFSGHGLRKDRGITEGFLASSDVNTSVGHWGLSLQWLRRLLQASPVRQQIVWLDCCYSGELLNFHEEANPGQREGFDRCFITASREYEVAYEEVAGNHGVLTTALLKGLNPECYANGVVDNITLVNFIKENLKNKIQRPLFTNFGGRIILTGKRIDIDNPIRSDICPYKGLEYFDYLGEDPKYFYGRDKLVDELLNKVRESNFLAVLGTSGSGKSSVVRAGLLFKLKQGLIFSGSEQWPIHIFRPSEQPLQDLSATLSKLVEMSTTKLILVIDQFEEVFTYHQDNEKLQPFFEYLLMILEKQTTNQLCLIITMQADFYSKCTEYAKLAKAIQNHTKIVTSIIEKEELQDAIVKPAKQVGLGIESSLVEKMIADVQKSPGSLPLLQYALTELWKKKQRGWLLLTTYNEMGGIENILANRTEEVYNRLLDEQKSVAKKFF